VGDGEAGHVDPTTLFREADLKSRMHETTYVGRDLEAMSFAPNYHRWILQNFSPHIGTRIAEVGAGIGNFSKLLLEKKPEILILLEPSPNLFEELKAKVSADDGILAYNGTLPDYSEKLGAAKLDTIAYVNVLEHIENDREELRLAFTLLQPGGKILIFVPAMQFLYGTFDHAVGHIRRYSESEIFEKLMDAGFKPKYYRYFDSVGVVPWFIAFKILRLHKLSNGMAGNYDKIVVPILRRIEDKFHPLFGKNIIAVGEKE